MEKVIAICTIRNIPILFFKRAPIFSSDCPGRTEGPTVVSRGLGVEAVGVNAVLWSRGRGADVVNL